MPYKIIKKGKYWKIYKIDDKVFAKPRFKTKQSATNQANNWLRYRHELHPMRFKKVQI